MNFFVTVFYYFFTSVFWILFLFKRLLIYFLAPGKSLL
jgi:hypothetical protein